MISSTSSHDMAVIGRLPSGIEIVCLCLVDTIAALSVSQNRYVPPAFVMQRSSMAKRRRLVSIFSKLVTRA